MKDKIYSGVRAATKEARLLSSDRYNRMLDSDSGNAAFKLALEAGFGGGAVTLDAASNYERRALSVFVKEESPTEEIKQYLLSKYDFVNAEAFLKSKYLKIDPKEMLFDCGLLELPFLKESIFNDKYDALNSFLKDALVAADKMFVDGNADGFKINNLFNKAYYGYLLSVVKTSILKKIVIKKIDDINLLAAFRCGSDEDMFDLVFVDGGSKPKEYFKKLGSLPLNELTKECMFDPDREFVMGIATDFFADKPLITGENASDSFALALLKDRRFFADGVEEFLRYCLYKTNEITNVNVIVVGLNAGAEKAAIKARLRECYEG